MKKITILGILLILSVVFIIGCKKTENQKPDTNITITGSITTNTTWAAANTYVISGEVYISNCTLTIEPGTTIKFGTGGVLYVGYNSDLTPATIIANGTPDKQIKFTSASATPTPGSWMGIWFYNNTSSNTSMTYCTVEYAGTDQAAAVELVDSKITMNNSTVKYAKTVGINITGNKGFVSFSNNTISDCGTHPIEIEASTIHTLGTGNLLSTTGSYGILINDGTFSQATGAYTWKKQTLPFYVSKDLYVDGNLTIEAGNIFKFYSNIIFYVGYHQATTLSVNGTSTSKVTFSSSAASPVAGSWKGIYIYSNTLSNTVFNYCDIIYAGQGGTDSDANIYLTGVNGMSITNCNISNSAGWGLIQDNSTFNSSMVLFTDNTKGSIKVI